MNRVLSLMLTKYRHTTSKYDTFLLIPGSSLHSLAGLIPEGSMRQQFYQTLTTQILRIIFLLYGIAAIAPGVALAEGHIGHNIQATDSSGFPGDLLIFPDVSFYSRFDQEPTRKLAENEVIPAVNLFYTVDYKQFRFLGEWLLSTKTQNLERFQLGLHIGEASLWLGRFHNPIGYWNMQFHHAAFLQTTVSRPGIMAFETAGGMIPNHLTGLLFEGLHEFGNAGLYYTLGAGADALNNFGLGAFNILDPKGSHRPGVSLRLGYQPISYGTDEIGISAAYTEIPGNNINVSKVKQVVTSVYGNWQLSDFRILSEAVYVHNWLDRIQGGKTDNGFVNAYGQLEWNFKPDWTVFGRVEGTFSNHNDPYLALFPKFVEDRFMGGIRYNLTKNMALKLEASRDHLRNDRFGQVMLQWSAIFP